MTILRIKFLAVLLLMISASGSVWADSYKDTVKVFKEAGASAGFFDTSYGYALFPTIGKGGIGIGGAYGKGRVYKKGGAYTGDTSMTQMTVGLQFGGQGYSQIIFFEDERAFTEFTSGQFEFGAQATAVAITAGASATTGTGGTSVGASGTKDSATTSGSYNKGMATFTVAKGGLIYGSNDYFPTFENEKGRKPDSSYWHGGNKLVNVYEMQKTDQCPEKISYHYWYSDEFKGVPETYSKKFDTAKGLKLFKLVLHMHGGYYEKQNSYTSEREYVFEMQRPSPEELKVAEGYFRRYRQLQEKNQAQQRHKDL